MQFNHYISKNILFFRRYYLLSAISILIASSIITGSMIIGDSVRATLSARVQERIARTESMIVSTSGLFKAELGHKLHGASLFMSNGFVPNNGTLTEISILGVDSTFMTVSDVPPPKVGEVILNYTAAKRIGAKAGDQIVVRLPYTNIVPSGSLFVEDNYTTSMRLKVAGIVEKEVGANLNLRNEQALPLNLFVNYHELASLMDAVGYANIVLLPLKTDSVTLQSNWRYEYSGISVIEDEIITDRIFFSDKTVSAICKGDKSAKPLFSYLVNSIGSIPYSFVTATDSFQSKKIGKGEIVLSDYTAKRLSAAVGDKVTINYYIAERLKKLQSKELELTVSSIIPLSDLQSDTLLSAKFPGLASAHTCTDWNSDLPIDMSLIKPIDEKYWDHYKTTPKALISYSEAAPLWASSYGSATGVRFNAHTNIDSLLSSSLSPFDTAIELLQPKEIGAKAAAASVDFTSLFLSLAFFIIISAAMLITIPLSQMMVDRKGDIELMMIIGYSRKRIKKMLIRESAPIVIVFSLLGTITAIGYNYLVLIALETIWSGALNTQNFITSIEPIALIVGFISTIAISFATIILLINRYFKHKEATIKEPKQRLTKFYVFLLLTVVSLFVAANNSVMFIITALLTLIAGIAFFDVNIFSKKNILTDKWLPIKTISYRHKQSITALAMLSIGIFTVMAVGLNRPDFSKAPLSATGGYNLWCNITAPIYHDINTEEGRAKLSLKTLSDSITISQLSLHSFDDASCLNLNSTPRPSVIGINIDDLQQSGFDFVEADKQHICQEMRLSDGFIPVVVDQTVAQWGIKKGVGDTLLYNNDKGEQVIFRITALLKNSIFQGSILIDKSNFESLWAESSGTKILLIKSNKPENDSQIISQALSNYGVSITTTAERLKNFNRVTDNYLTIFLMLGSVALLLAIVGIVLIVRKNMLSRQNEILLLKAMGYSDIRIEKLLIRESLFTPIYGVILGTTASILSVAGGVGNVSLMIWLWVMAIIAFMIITLYIFTKTIVRDLLSKLACS